MRPTRVHIGHHFYGAGNVGDDLMMAAFLHAWRSWGSPAQLSCCTPFDRTAQERRFPDIAWLPYDPAARAHAVRNCTVWLGLGGPAFETDSGEWMLEHLEAERLLCRKHGKPMFFLCVGVSNRDALKDPRARAVLEQAERVWTRDALVAEFLTSEGFGAKTEPGADLSHLVLARQAPLDWTSGSLGWILHFDDVRKMSCAALEEAVKRLAGRTHYWLVQEIRTLRGSERETFAALSEQVKSRMELRLLDYEANRADALLDAWPGCETVISSRFHGALAFAWRGARLALVERNDKLRGLARVLGCPVVPDACDADRLVDATERAQVVDRRVLDCQAEVAWTCCRAFVCTINGGAKT